MNGFASFLLLATATMVSSQELNEIVFVDHNFVYENSDLGREIERRINAEFERIRDENEGIDEGLASEEQSLADRRDELSAQDFALLAQDFDEKSEYFRRKNQAEQKNFSLRQETWQGRFFGVVERIVSQWASQSAIKLVLVENQVLWVSPELNISDEIVTILDKEYIRDRDTIDGIIFAEISGLEPIEPLPESYKITNNETIEEASGE